MTPLTLTNKLARSHACDACLGPYLHADAHAHTCSIVYEPSTNICSVLYARWLRSHRKKLPVSTRKPIKKYAVKMGKVDQVDKNFALSRIRLTRAMLRYHRVIFEWYICLVLNNSMALIVFIFLEYEELQRKKEATGIGYKHYYQNLLGNVIITRGLEMAEEYWTHWAATKLTSWLRRVLVLKRARSLRTQKPIARQSLVNE